MKKKNKICLSSLFITVPNPVVLEESDSTVNSVSATWMKPTGEVSSYDIECSLGDVMGPLDQSGNGPFLASCENLTTPGDQYTMNVASISNGKRSDETTITLTALPNSVVLNESVSTVNSVSATWMKPTGEVSSYDIECSLGDVVGPPDQSGNGTFSASCENLTTPGDQYTMNVASISNGKRSDETTITLTACKLKLEKINKDIS
ncbi:uncharacterized protein LOC121405892 [Lytechinus variegatus]|uniref:uncharacterized protein LOC121405892 n=1 Tax=Lytechinus variegatus TaxID=7654 RepID=UPI001BB21544|nr:uncharacterized protein LOC121405892 [Lytechinus variegatus]